MANDNFSDYHREVSDYYDEDARLGFEDRANANPLLDRIRNDFRTITTTYDFTDALEIGCGPGFDIQWFASAFPDRQFTGIDISREMVRLAGHRLKEAGLVNARVMQSDESQLPEHFHSSSFDLVYVYFGALNTVEDLPRSARIISDLLKPGGHAVLTFVNKWYMREMLVQLAKGRAGRAMARIRKVWGGYSPERYLPSRCYSPSEVKRAFRGMTLAQKKGYSILYPAWYNSQKFRGQERKLDRLWSLDQKMQNTLCWSKGEYTLFVFRKG